MCSYVHVYMQVYVPVHVHAYLCFHAHVGIPRYGQGSIPLVAMATGSNAASDARWICPNTFTVKMSTVMAPYGFGYYH